MINVVSVNSTALVALEYRRNTQGKKKLLVLGLELDNVYFKNKLILNKEQNCHHHRIPGAYVLSVI